MGLHSHLRRAQTRRRSRARYRGPRPAAAGCWLLAAGRVRRRLDAAAGNLRTAAAAPRVGYAGRDPPLLALALTLLYRRGDAADRAACAAVLRKSHSAPRMVHSSLASDRSARRRPPVGDRGRVGPQAGSSAPKIADAGDEIRVAPACPARGARSGGIDRRRRPCNGDAFADDSRRHGGGSLSSECAMNACPPHPGVHPSCTAPMSIASTILGKARADPPSPGVDRQRRRLAPLSRRTTLAA